MAPPFVSIGTKAQRHEGTKVRTESLCLSLRASVPACLRAFLLQHRPRIVRAACPRRRRRSSRTRAEGTRYNGSTHAPNRAIDPMPSDFTRACQAIRKAGLALPSIPSDFGIEDGLL